MPEFWSAKRFRVWAVIGGQRFDVVQVTATYELNAIPTAMLILPVGRNVTTLQYSPAHTGGANFADRQRFPKLAEARVYVRATTIGQSGTLAYPLEGTFLVFAGYVIGTSWTRTDQSAGLVVHLIHWLSLLDFSSTLSADSHPTNPFAFTFGACGETGLQAGGDARVPSAAVWLHGRDGKGTLTPQTVTADLWAALRDMLIRLTRYNTIEARGVLGQNAGASDKKDTGNAEARAALLRMVSRNMALADDAADASVVAQSIVHWLTVVTRSGPDVQNEATLASFAHRTFWNKIVEVYAPNFQFQLVPRIYDCLVTPNVGGLRQVWKTIRANEYNTFDTQCQIRRVLGAVVLAYPMYLDAGGSMTPLQPASQLVPPLNQLNPIVYPNPPKEGLRLYRQPPAWLDTSYNFGQAATATTGSQGETVSTAFSRRPSTKPVQNKARQAAEAQKTLMQRYCHQLYVQEALKDRYGELAGRFRMDIAPGSSIRIEGLGERTTTAIGTTDTLRTNLYAKVTRVVLLIDAQNARAATAFAFTHLRTEAENGDEDLTVSVPPLYKEAWVGEALYGYPRPEDREAETAAQQAFEKENRDGALS